MIKFCGDDRKSLSLKQVLNRFTTTSSIYFRKLFYLIFVILTMTSFTAGKLYIVATPIGNLADISKRALECLEQVDFIVAEDTRHTKKLLHHYGISSPLKSLHSHNEAHKSKEIINLIKTGRSVALVSDAGTPLISDPGFPLVKIAREEKIIISPIPGSCALIAALSASGLATDRFCFEGFLPAKTEARLNYLNTLSLEARTLCFYEAPHRLLDCLLTMQTAFGQERKIVVAKELSKTFERFFCGYIGEVISDLSYQPEVIKGELVIMIEGAKENLSDKNQIEKLMKVLLAQNISTKQASLIAVEYLGCKKNEAYQIGLQIGQATT